MNRKIVWVILLIILFSVSSTPTTPLVSANSNDDIGFSSGVYLYSPINTTYCSRFLTLNLTFGQGMGVRCSLNYSIDGQYSGPIPVVPKNNELHVVIQTIGLVQLPELSEGSHCLVINVEGDLIGIHSANPPGAPFQPTNAEGTDYAARWTHVIYFTIDTNAPAPDSTPPTITIQSPQNTTYTTTTLPLNFTINEQTTNITYCLDGNTTTIPTQNTTLTNLSTGEHNLTITAQDAAGNVGTSQTVQFTITNPTPAPPQQTQPPPAAEPSTTAEPSPITIAAIILAAGLTIETIVFIIVKRRKT